VQDEGINTISPIESDNEVNKEYNNSALVVEEEVLENSLMESLEEVNMVLEESHDISPLKPPNSSLTMLDVQHVKSLEQHAPHPLMLDVQHIIGLEQRVEFPDPLPLTRDEKDEDNHNLLGCVQTILITASNSVCFTPHPQSYSVQSYEPGKLVDFLPMSPHSKMSDSTESFTCKVHNLHIGL
jgi:hypothetical protein